MHSWVPPGTAAFGSRPSIPDRWARLSVRGPSGEVRLEQAGNYALTDEFRVDVPAGEDGRIWSLAITECEDSYLYLFGVPPYLSQKAGAGMVASTSTP